MHSIAPGKCAALIPCTAPYLEVLKLPNWNEPPLEELGGVPLRLIHVVEKVGAEAVKHISIDMHESGGVPLDANGTATPTQVTASVEPFGMAEKATTAKPEVLEPRAESAAWCMLKTLPPLLSHKNSGRSRMLL